MPEVKARKMTYDELFNSTTMFYMNPDYEAEIEKAVQAKTAEISVGLRTITDKDSLKQYISNRWNKIIAKGCKHFGVEKPRKRKK